MIWIQSNFVSIGYILKETLSINSIVPAQDDSTTSIHVSYRKSIK